MISMDAVIELPAAANSSIDTSRPVVVNPAQSAGPFSFDEVMGLMVDTIQAYGHELIRVRRKTTELQSMIRILEANLVGEVDGDLPDTPSGEGAVGDFNSVDTYIQGARRVAKKMYRPPLEQSPSLDIEFSQAELLRARVKSQSMKSFTEPNSPNQALALESLATPSPPDSARLNDGLNELPVFRSQSPDSGGQNSRNAPRGRRPSIVQQMNQRADDRDEEARAKMDEMQSEMKAMSETVQQMQNARLDDAAAMATVEAQNKEALKLQASESVMLKAMLAEAAAKEEASRAASAVSAAEGEEAVGKAMALAKKAAEAAEAAATRAEMIKTTSSPGVAKPNRQEIDPLTVDDPIATFAAKKAEEAAKKADDQAKAALKAELKGIKSDVSGLQEKLNNPKPLAPAAAAAPTVPLPPLLTRRSLVVAVVLVHAPTSLTLAVLSRCEPAFELFGVVAVGVLPGAVPGPPHAGGHRGRAFASSPVILVRRALLLLRLHKLLLLLVVWWVPFLLLQLLGGDWGRRA
mmetsp:Transcript_64474/g.129658  ORF Transcript_64474/g.129658 Transcript_64474/m.129658 type:complete len:520 (-) Transcript_64474:88-1647(-)